MLFLSYVFRCRFIDNGVTFMGPKCATVAREERPIESPTSREGSPALRSAIKRELFTALSTIFPLSLRNIYIIFYVYNLLIYSSVSVFQFQFYFTFGFLKINCKMFCFAGDFCLHLRQSHDKCCVSLRYFVDLAWE